MVGILFMLILSITYLGISGTIPSEGIESTSTVCYGPDTALLAVCTASRIAITGFYYGFKLNSIDCSLNDSCCDYVESTDCLEALNTSSTQIYYLSGREDGTIVPSNKVRQSCNSSYSAISTYNLLKYQCIDRIRISEMCTRVDSTSASGKPFYLWNTGYTHTGIFADDTSCTCSVEASSPTADFYLYILHIDLYDDPTNCQQSITVTDGNGYVIYTFQCETPEFNTVQTIIVPGPYIALTMANSHSSTGGQFWIGFEVTDPAATISLDCPASPVPDCGTPARGAHSTVTSSGTIYSSVAEYNCTEGYVYESGDYRRVCLNDGQWNGTVLVCVNDCGTPARGEYSTVTTTGTVYGSVAVYSCIQGYLYESGDTQRYCLEDDQWNGTILVCAKGEVVGTVVGAALGALAVGIFVGVAGIFVCHRLKIHLRRADTSHHGNIQLEMRGQDVIVEQGAPREMGDSTPDVNAIPDYQELELYEVDLDRTYSTVSS